MPKRKAWGEERCSNRKVEEEKMRPDKAEHLEQRRKRGDETAVVHAVDEEREG